MWTKWLGASAVCLALACTPGQEEENPDIGAPTPGDTSMSEPRDVDCMGRCVQKAVSCGAPAEQASLACSMDWCTGTPDEDYVACLENAPCVGLMDPQEIERACGTPSSSPGCEGYPRCEGPSVVTCSIVAGAAATESRACGANETCSAGACQQNACIQSGEPGCNALNNPSNCCDDRQTCFSNGNTRGETICCARTNDSCDRDSDCCNNDSPDFPNACIAGVCGPRI